MIWFVLVPETWPLCTSISSNTFELVKSFIYIFPVLIFTISEKFKTMFSDGEKLVELSAGEVLIKEGFVVSTELSIWDDDVDAMVLKLKSPFWEIPS